MVKNKLGYNLPFWHCKPPPGAFIDYEHPLSRYLSAVVMCHGSVYESDLISKNRLRPETTLPLIESGSALFGPGWRNVANTAIKLLVSNSAFSYFRGQSNFSIFWLVRPITVPAAAASQIYFSEPVANNTNPRLNLTLTNGLIGATGVKWTVSFRTGLGNSTQRNVNGGAGGTVVVAERYYRVAFTFDSNRDTFRIYVNGLLDGTLNVAENPIADTANETVRTRFLVNSADVSPCDGLVYLMYVWKGLTLTAGEIAEISNDPYSIFELSTLRRWWWDTAVTGGQTFTVSVSDSIVLNDGTSRIVTYNRAPSDGIVENDSVQRTVQYERTVQDSEVLADAVLRLVTYNRTLSDSFVLNDALLRVVTYLRSVSDSEVLNDALLRLVTYNRNPSDSIVLSDALLRLVTYNRNPSDSFVLNDAVLRLVTYNRTLSDSIVLNDAVLKAVTYNRTLSDSIVLNDAVLKVVTYLRSVSDSEVLNDALLRLVTYNRDPLDSFVLNDALLRLVTYNRDPSDSIVLNDALLRLVTYNRTLSDSFVLNDLVQRLVTYNRTNEDSIVLNDAVSLVVEVIAALTIAVVDSIVLSDSISRSVDYQRSVSDSIVLSDLVTVIILFLIQVFFDIILVDKFIDEVNLTDRLVNQVNLMDKFVSDLDLGETK